MKPALGSILENPLSTSFSAMVRCMVGANGLSRQASSMTSRRLRPPPTAAITCSSATHRDHLLQHGRLGFGVLVGGELRIDRHQVIDAADLEAVAGIIHHRPI